MSEARPASVLAELRRGPILEGVVRGHVVVVDAPGNLVAWSGLPETRTALRSALKPLQAASLVESGAADALGLDERSLAVACASHQGEPGHLVEVRRLLELGGVAADSLRCGAHPPADPQASRQLVLAGESPTALHNNCSGKHAGLLVASRQRGWPLAGYLERHHPIQEEIAARLGRHCGHPAEQLVYGTDGCGLPTYELTLLEFASALLSATREDQAVRRCQAAMSAHPWLVGGSTSFDTALMELVGERLSCKGGAAGLFGAV
ncbi:MAG: asparaginase, partial [Candidatus Dormibacteria bacterium]